MHKAQPNWFQEIVQLNRTQNKNNTTETSNLVKTTELQPLHSRLVHLPLGCSTQATEVTTTLLYDTFLYTAFESA